MLLAGLNSELYNVPTADNKIFPVKKGVHCQVGCTSPGSCIPSGRCTSPGMSITTTDNWEKGMKKKKKTEVKLFSN